MVQAVQTIAGFRESEEDKGEMSIPSFAIQVGNHLKRVANVQAGLAIRSGDKALRDCKCWKS